MSTEAVFGDWKGLSINLAIAGGYLIAGCLAKKVWLGYIFWGTALGLFLIDLWAINLKVIRDSKD
ncbi:MAG TPA: hypothetical protein VHY08_13935 [Bacillota bacterium]|nr:hypothetical protein [Bacillota bacterium]